MSNAERKTVLALGDVTYDRGAEVLRDASGVEIPIRPQSAQTLKLLAARVGETVTKDELIEVVWAGLSVTDDSIVQCIADIRRSIGDSNRKILRTVPKRGYCLIAETRESPVAAALVSDTPDTLASVLAFARRSGATVCVLLAHPAPEHQAAFVTAITQLATELNGRVTATSPGRIGVECDSAMAAADLALKAGQWSTAYTATVSPNAPVQLRIGIDAGFAGDMPPPRAAFLAALAHPGDIIVPGDVSQLLTAGLDCDILDIGDRVLPEIEDRVRCYKIFERSATPFATLSVNREDLLPTIAVIPFKARSADPAAAVLGEVLADDVISLLSRSLEINVISRLSTTRFSNRTSTLSEIGSMLDANYVLSGRYIIRSSQLEVHAELSEVSTGRVLWADTETCPVDQSFDAPEIIEWIVERVQKSHLHPRGHAGAPATSAHTGKLYVADERRGPDAPAVATGFQQGKAAAGRAD